MEKLFKQIVIPMGKPPTLMKKLLQTEHQKQVGRTLKTRIRMSQKKACYWLKTTVKRSGNLRPMGTPWISHGHLPELSYLFPFAWRICSQRMVESRC